MFILYYFKIRYKRETFFVWLVCFLSYLLSEKRIKDEENNSFSSFQSLTRIHKDSTRTRRYKRKLIEKEEKKKKDEIRRKFKKKRKRRKNKEEKLGKWRCHRRVQDAVKEEDIPMDAFPIWNSLSVDSS